MNIKNIRSDQDGVALVEFALLAPIIIGSLLGVMQVGLGMQAYNSLRNISADAARYALVEYQKEVEIDASDIKDRAEDIATSAPYLLNQNNLDVDVTRPDTQRVDGAIEYSISIEYRVNSILPMFDVEDYTITYTRPIFVLDV